MKTLNLIIKQCYFDEIIKGTKKQEFREVKPTTIKRLVQLDKDGYEVEDENGNAIPIQYDALQLYVGYAKNRASALVEVKVIRFVYDEMIKYRNDAGDAYRDLSSAIGKIVPADFMPKAMQKVAEALNWIVFGCHEKMARNKYGDENKQRELYQLEKKIADLINDGFIKNYDSLINYLRKKYQENQYPKVFRTA